MLDRTESDCEVEMIFILGGKGFVGSGFVRHCEQNGIEYRVIDIDNYNEYIGKSCDILVNANGNSRKYLAEEMPMEEFSASVTSVRSSLVDFETGLYVYLSTCDVYPDSSSPATTLESVQFEPTEQTAYGFHKNLAEQCVRHAADNWLIARMGGFVGPGMKKNSVFDVLNGGPLWVDPASEFQFMHTDDNARIVLELAAGTLKNDVVNVGSQGVISVREIMDIAGKEVEVKESAKVVRCEMSTEKLSGLIDIPTTRDVVKDFIEKHEGAVG